MRDVSNSRHHFKTSRRKLTVEFTCDNIAREPRTSFISSGESLAGHPDEKAISAAISWWRAGAARDSDEVCFACRTIFGFGRANPIAFLVSIGANVSDATIAGLCTACFQAKTDAETDVTAARMLRRLTSPRGRLLDPLPSETKYERLGELLRKYGLDLINSEQFWAEMKQQGFGQADIDEWCDEYHRKTEAEQ